MLKCQLKVVVCPLSGICCYFCRNHHQYLLPLRSIADGAEGKGQEELKGSREITTK
jgi:hypothetical protein